MPEKSEQNRASEDTVSSLHKEKRNTEVMKEYGKTILIALLAAFILKMFVVEAYRIPSGSMENTLQVGDFLLVNKLAYGFRTPRRLPYTEISLPSFTIPLFGHLHNGDVVVFEYPGHRDEVKPSEPVNYIKRCIGLPGDTVEIRAGRVIVNGIEMGFPPLGKRTHHSAGNPFQNNEQIFPIGSSFNDVNYGPIVVPKRGDVWHINSAAFWQWRVFIEREGHSAAFSNDTILIDGAVTSTYCVKRNYYFMLGDNRDNSMDSRYWGFVPDENLVGEALFVYWSWQQDAPVSNILDKFSTIRWNRIGKFIR
jgi:signal peptidase I